MLTNMDCFSIGVYTTVFIYFLYLFFSYKEDTYNLYFSFGCLIAITRVIVTKNLIGIKNTDSMIYMVSSSLYYLSYIWGGLFLMLISESLFKTERLKHIRKVFTVIAMIFSVFIVFTDVSVYSSQDAFYDGSFFLMLAYSIYILVKAVVKKRTRAVLICLGSFIMYFGAFHDILRGGGVFDSKIGEINAYTYFIYLLIFAYVLSQNTKEHQLSIFNSELNFLHAQIQPHFLFNTINTIITYCRQEPNMARELLLDLSTYLRGKFDYDSENMQIALKEEIELIKSYLTIEKVRFGDRLQIVYDIDDDIDISVPCLIFQPIIENAVKHGLHNNIKGVKIQIVVKRIDNYIYLQVKDNGKGIDEETLFKIQNQESTGVGINNTSKRLKLYYDTDLIIKSSKNQGTCITIKIPVGGKNVKLHNC